MAYFETFKPILVDFSQLGGDPQPLLVSDILTNVRIKQDLLKNLVYYDTYDIQDGDTPEIVSELFYGTPDYHWVVMLVNERFDYINDFPMTQYALENYVAAKYGENNIYDIHHYEESNGFVVNSDYVNTNGQADATPITNYDYEVYQNEMKRSIKMIPTNFIGDVLARFGEILK